MFAELAEAADFEEVFLDSTIVRAHQHAAGAVREKGPQAIGQQGREARSYFRGLAATPRNIVARINAEVNTLVKEPLIIERLAKQSLEPLVLSPDAFDQLLRSNFEKMAKVVAISGAKVE